MDFSELREVLAWQLSASVPQLLSSVLAAVAIYIVFWGYVRLFGPRILHGMSTFDAVLVIMLGSVAGRVILANTPTLLPGIVGLATLLLLEALFGLIRTSVGGRKVLNSRPMLLVADGEFIEKNMRRAHVTDAELNYAVRQSGARHYGEVAAVIFEPNGQLSVLNHGELIDPRLLGEVQGVEHLPQHLILPESKRHDHLPDPLT